MAISNSDSIWTRTFLLLCAAQFLGYAQHSMLNPILPLYVTQLGGSPFVVGMVLASFAAMSVIVRPLVCHWADRWSEGGVMIGGLLFQGASIFICFIPLVGATMLANGLRGMGWGGLNTGGYSLLARIAPAAPRGGARVVCGPPRPGDRRPPRDRDNLDAMVARDLSFHRAGNFPAVHDAFVAQCVAAVDHQFQRALRARAGNRLLRFFFYCRRRHRPARPAAARPFVGQNRPRPIGGRRLWPATPESAGNHGGNESLGHDRLRRPLHARQCDR